MKILIIILSFCIANNLSAPLKSEQVVKNDFADEYMKFLDLEKAWSFIQLNMPSYSVEFYQICVQLLFAGPQVLSQAKEYFVYVNDHMICHVAHQEEVIIDAIQWLKSLLSSGK